MFLYNQWQMNISNNVDILTLAAFTKVKQNDRMYTKPYNLQQIHQVYDGYIQQ